MYKLIYIDEERDWRNTFQLKAKGRFDVEAIEPLATVEETVEQALSLNPDAIVTDFKLKEYQPEVDFDGVDLVNFFIGRRGNLPCFVLTQYESDALSSAEDVNFIYEKCSLSSKPNALFNRFEQQIKNFSKRAELAQADFERLLKKSKTDGLTLCEEEELCRLDGFLESIGTGKHSIPDNLKSHSGIEKLNSIISGIEDVLKRKFDDGN